MRKLRVVGVAAIAEARARIGWQEAAIEIHDRLAAGDAEHFGGLWIDQADGGRVKIGAVGSSARIDAAVEAAGISQVTDVVAVQSTWSQLNADLPELKSAAERINKTTGDPEPAVVPITKTSENRNVLYVPEALLKVPATAAAVTELKAALGRRLVVDSTKTLAISNQVCSNNPRTCDAPLRGGIKFHLPYAGGYCSTGFNARSNSDGKWYMMTAGHCGRVGTHFDVYQPTTCQWHMVGHMHASRNTSSSGDVLDVNVGGYSLARANYCSANGDSGGSIYSNHTARGLHRGILHDDGTCRWALFQGIRDAASNLNVHVYTG